jgi:predicted dehydrogenase
MISTPHKSKHTELLKASQSLSELKCSAGLMSITDIANDANVDLVVSNIRVDKHAASVRPAILAGKDVFVEWPLEANAQKSRELRDLAREKGVRTVVGLQGRYDALARKIKALLDSGRIGQVTSADFSAIAPMGQRIPSQVDYL